VDADTRLGVPICGPFARQPAVVGAGIFGDPNCPWRGNGIFATDYAVPGYMAREPDEGWWKSEARDSETGEHVWMTNLSGLGFLVGDVDVFGRSIPRWAAALGVTAIGLAGYAMWKARKTKRNRRMRSRRNAWVERKGRWVDKHPGCPAEGDSSPWGKIDHVQFYEPGLCFVSTPGHGGFKLDRLHNSKIPLPYRLPGGWYEEDAEAAVVAHFFPQVMREGTSISREQLDRELSYRLRTGQ
jgi:hypothetical protein